MSWLKRAVKNVGKAAKKVGKGIGRLAHDTAFIATQPIASLTGKKIVSAPKTKFGTFFAKLDKIGITALEGVANVYSAGAFGAVKSGLHSLTQVETPDNTSLVEMPGGGIISPEVQEALNALGGNQPDPEEGDNEEKLIWIGAGLMLVIIAVVIVIILKKRA